MTIRLDSKPRPLMYLGSVYTKYPDGKEAAFRLACRKAGELMKGGYAIFCPIAHSHPVESWGCTPSTHDFWLAQDVAVLDKCAGMFAYLMPGHEDSFGLNWEIDYMRGLGKPVIYLPWEGEWLRKLYQPTPRSGRISLWRKVFSGIFRTH